jgi:hypothetical protein
MDYRKIGFWQLVILALLLNFVVQTIHESGHWSVCEALGHGPVWGFTQLLQIWGDPPPVHPENWIATVSPDGEKGWMRLSSALSSNELSFVLVAGPIASILAVFFGLFLIHCNCTPATKQIGLVMSLIGSLIMSQYYLRGFSRMGGDEYFLAANLGIPKYIIDIPFGLLFILGFLLGVRALGDWRTRIKWLGAIMIGSVPSGLFLMKANELVLNQVSQENPLFRPLLGWSLPVVIVNVIVCLVIWIWWRKSKKKLYNSLEIIL